MLYRKIISLHGVPRSGTSWFGQIFNSSPNVRFKYQPLFSYAFKDRISLNSNEKEIRLYYDSLYNYADNFLDQHEKIEKGIYPVFKIKRKQPEFLITKMVRYHYLIPHLLEVIDNIIVLAIIRHPCGVLFSWKKNPREFKKEWNYQKEWRFGQSKNRFRPEEYFGFNRWKEATKLFLETESKYPKKFKLIKYEDLVNEPVKETKQLFDFCGIELEEQTLDFLTKSRQNHQNDVSSVYKGKKDIEDWKDGLDLDIIKIVLNELSETEFDRFMD
jgi:hypothetical protein